MSDAFSCNYPVTMRMLVTSFKLATAVLATTEPTPASNLEWALTHRRAFIVGWQVGGGNDPALGLKYVHKHVVPALLNDSSLWANHRACHVVDVGAASYGPATGYDYSDSLLFLASLGRQCTIHAFDLSASKLLD